MIEEIWFSFGFALRDIATRDKTTEITRKNNVPI